MPLTNRARKHTVVTQCVTRTRAECREVTVVAGTTEPEVVGQTEPSIWGAYQRLPMNARREAWMMFAVMDLNFTTSPEGWRDSCYLNQTESHNSRLDFADYSWHQRRVKRPLR